MAYEGHGAGAEFPPTAAPDGPYAGTTLDDTASWYGYTYDQSAATTQSWPHDPYATTTATAPLHHLPEQPTAHSDWGADPGTTAMWTTAAFAMPDGTAQFPVQDSYGGLADPAMTASYYDSTGYGHGHGFDPHQGYSGYHATQADTEWATATVHEGGNGGNWAHADAEFEGHDQAEEPAAQDGPTAPDADVREDWPTEEWAPAPAGLQHGDERAPEDAATPEDWAPEEWAPEGWTAEDRPTETWTQEDGAAEDWTQGEPAGASPDDSPAASEETAPPAPGGRAAARAAARNRPKTRTAKRSALLTIAVPSVAVMGVAAAAAVTVSVPDNGAAASHDSAAGGHSASPTATTASSTPNSQVAKLRQNAAAELAASRDQARADLKKRQAAERKRKEAQRPKYVLPVMQHGLSATFGMAGSHWAALHTGIDFPVAWGTRVMAATDGTVRTQWNSAYGYMAIVTAPDGTETWYCHLSSYRIRSGSVKAGEVIAYSGSTGNSTGPHLHFEVHPGGEGTPAVDPIPWLLSHGLDPR